MSDTVTGNHTANNFPFMYSHKIFNQVLNSNINYIFPKQNYNVLSGIMIFCSEVQYNMQQFSCPQRAQDISKRNFEIIVVQRDSIFSNSNFKDGPGIC